MCSNSYLASAFLADLEKCFALDTACIIEKAASFRLACLDNEACEQVLDAAFAAKQFKFPNKDLDSPADPNASRVDGAHALNITDVHDTQDEAD